MRKVEATEEQVLEFARRIVGDPTSWHGDTAGSQGRWVYALAVHTLAIAARATLLQGELLIVKSELSQYRRR